VIKSQNGVNVDTAINGEEAIYKFKEALLRPCKCNHRIYKVIFMDIQMPPGMTGIECTAKMKKEVEIFYENKEITLKEIGCNIIAHSALNSE